MKAVALVVSLLAFGIGGPVRAASLAGVQLPDTETVNGKNSSSTAGGWAERPACAWKITWRGSTLKTRERPRHPHNITHMERPNPQLPCDQLIRAVGLRMI